MRHRTSLVSGLPLLLMSAALVAQEPLPPPPRQPQMQQLTQQHPVVRQRLEVLMRGIALAPEQQSRVDSIIRRHHPEIERLAGAGMGGAPRDPAGGRQDQGKNDELSKALERQEKEIRGVLTPVQQQTWDRNAEQLKQEKGVREE